MYDRYRLRRRSIRLAVNRGPLGRSPGDRAPPRFPPEPPPLARATPEGRAAAAQEGSASLWWARASAPHDRKATRTLGDFSEQEPEQVTSRGLPITQTDHRRPSVPTAHHSPAGPSHASSPRPLSIGQHDTSAGTGGRNASRLEVGNLGVSASEIAGAGRRWSLGQSGTTAAQRQRPISFAPPVRSGHRWRAAGDFDPLHRHRHPTDAAGRAGGSTCARKLTLRTGDRGCRSAAADRSQSDGAGRGETGLDDTRDAPGQSWTER